MRMRQIPPPQSDGESFPYTVLLVLCGRTPAVVTETVWALVERGDLPDEIIVLTTETGREDLIKALFEQGIWLRLRNRLNPPAAKLRFGNSQYHIRLVAQPSRQRDSADIRQADEASEFGDFVLNVLREYTENQDTRVVFSVAGGRKSMTAVALQCMSLLARPRDRACHVLVPAPFDAPRLDPAFYFPTDTEHVCGEKTVSGADVTVTLHDIPFIRCRDVFRREYARLPGTFRDTVLLANRTLQMPRVTLIPARLSCQVGGSDIRLGITEYAFFWMLCKRCAEGRPAVPNAYMAHVELKRFVAGAAQFLLERAAQPGIRSRLPHYAASETDAEMEEAMRKLSNRITRKLRDLGQVPNMEPVFPSRGRGRGYGLDLPPEDITIAD